MPSHFTRQLFATIGILCALFFTAYSEGHAASSKTQKSEPKSAGKKVEKEAAKPDLVISLLELDKKCEIVVGIKNQGMGSIDSADFKQLVVQVKMGSAFKNVPVAAHDTEGRVLRPGGTATIQTGQEVPKPGVIEARVDGTNVVAEASESNNTRRQNVNPSCQNDYANKRTGSKALLTPTEGSKRAQRKAATIEDDGAENQPGAESSVPPSTISVSAIEEYRNAIFIVLKRDGRKPLDEQALRQLRLQMEAGKTRRMWPLMVVDPMLRGLNGKQGEVRFDTRVELEEPTMVRARIVGSVPPETSVTAMLKPSSDVSSTFRGIQIDDQKTKLKGDKGKNQKPGVSQTGRPQAKGDDDGANSGSIGIGMHFVSPRGGETYGRGGEIEIGVLFDSEANVRSFKLALLRGSRRIPLDAGTTPSPERKMLFRVPLPTTLTEDGDYRLEAITVNGGPRARSERFAIVKQAPPPSSETASQAVPIDGGQGEGAIGEGGGSAQAGGPSLSLLAPRSGEHYPVTDVSLGIRWAYRGRLSEAPSSWQLEIFDASDNSVVFRGPVPCDGREDRPAEGLETLDTRTCNYSYVMFPEIDGDYRVRISGAGLYADLGIGHSFHWGANREWPWIQLFAPTPFTGGVIKGDPIPVHFFLTPADGAISVSLYRGLDEVYVDDRGPRDSTLNESGSGRFCRYEIPSEDLVPDSNYRIVVSGIYHPTAKAETGRLIVHDPPFEDTDPEAVDFVLSSNSLRVTENGRVEVYTSVHRATQPEYMVHYVLGKGEGASGGRRIEKTIPGSSGWIDLAHIETLVTPEERRDHSRMTLKVWINQPVEIVESSYVNNIADGSLIIRRSSAAMRIRSTSGFWDERGNTLYYSRAGSGYETQATLVFSNDGYGPVDGVISVRQAVLAGEPGELSDGSTEFVRLGRREIHLPAVEGGAHGEAYETRVSLFGDGISEPRWQPGQIEIRFEGDLRNYQTHTSKTFNFLYRD